jgi:hypothetical protein
MPKKQEVDTLERETFEKFQEVIALAFKTDGLSGVLQVSGQALEVAKAVSAAGEQSGLGMSALKAKVAESLLTNWIPGIVKWLNTDGSIRSLK